MPGACLASFAIRSVRVEMTSESNVSTIYPPNNSLLRPLTSLDWVPSDRFPNVAATTKALRLLVDLLPARSSSLSRTARCRRRRDLPASWKTLALVPCSMTPAQSALRPMLPSAFPDGVGLCLFLYGAQSHGPIRSLSTLRLYGHPQRRKTRFQLYLRPWLGRDSHPQGFTFKVSAHGSILLNQAWAGAPGTSEGRKGRAKREREFWGSRCRRRMGE